MAQFTNGFGEDRVCPTLGYILVPAGAAITVPDDEAHHWAAAGWTRTDIPAAAPAKTSDKTAAAAVEGASE